MTRTVTCWALLLSLSSAGPALAAGESVAFTEVDGPREAGAERLGKGLVEGLGKRGLAVISEAVLKRTGERKGKRLTPAEEARKAGADFLLVAEVSRNWKSWVATVRLFDTDDGEEVFSLSRPYSSAKKAKKTGGVLAALIAQAAANASGDEDEEPRPVVRPKEEEEEEEEEEERAEAAPRVVPKDEATSGAATTLTPAEDGARRGEGRGLRLAVGLGSQLHAAYAVAAAGTVTGHTYVLGASPLFGVTGRWASETSGLELEAGLAYVPTKYLIELSDRTEPLTPTGHNVQLAFAGAWRFHLTGWGEGGALTVAPVAGFSYDSLSISEAGDDTAVVGAKSLGLAAGGRLTVAVSELLAVEATVLGRFLPFYSEKPTTTGQDGSGVGARAAAEGRYWLNGRMAVLLDLRYDYAKVDFTGVGSRVRFAGDPTLVDAALAQSDLRASVGFAYAP